MPDPTPNLTAGERLRNACQQAADLYDALSLGTLEAAAKYGPDWEPPTDEQMLEVRSVLAAALAKEKGGG